MFPADVTEFTTEGERETYHFFRGCAKPDSACLCWYQPDIRGYRPDFLLYMPAVGLVFFEVKDWSMDRIVYASRDAVEVVKGRGTMRCKHPLNQAREYLDALLSLIADKNLFPSFPDGKRRLPFPMVTGAIFPHASREDLERSLLGGAVTDLRHCLTWTEMNDASPISRDGTGQRFRAWMEARFELRFSYQPTADDIARLRCLIYPENHLPAVRGNARQQQEEIVRVFDTEQENTARSIRGGRHLVTGPSGSGKTTMLAAVAGTLVRQGARRVLVTHFNLSLAGFIRHLLFARRVPFGANGVTVAPFYEVCRMILGEEVSHSGEDAEYYRTVRELTAARLEAEPELRGTWDAILVDEGQDFTPGMADILLSLLRKDGTLVVAQDRNQAIYDGENAWGRPEAGIGTVHVLRRVYRNTRAIARAALGLLPGGPDGAGGPELRGAAGIRPEIMLCPSADAMLGRVGQTVEHLVRVEGLPMNQVGVLYLRSAMRDGRGLLRPLREALEGRGMLTRAVCLDVHAKQRFDITTDSVAICSVHSAKGMDFTAVILLGMDSLNPERARDRRLAYVGFTRARERLYVPVTSRDGLVPELG